MTRKNKSSSRTDYYQGMSFSDIIRGVRIRYDQDQKEHQQQQHYQDVSDEIPTFSFIDNIRYALQTLPQERTFYSSHNMFSVSYMSEWTVINQGFEDKIGDMDENDYMVYDRYLQQHGDEIKDLFDAITYSSTQAEAFQAYAIAYSTIVGRSMTTKEASAFSKFSEMS